MLDGIDIGIGTGMGLGWTGLLEVRDLLQRPRGDINERLIERESVVYVSLRLRSTYISATGRRPSKSSESQSVHERLSL